MPGPSPKQCLLALWELPQNVLGALLLGVSRLRGGVEYIDVEHGRIFVRAPGIGIFQSRMLGPLYLPLVGIPSSMRAGYAVLYRELTGKQWFGYYDGYPERWADELGGISVEERRRSLTDHQA